jgi:O-methyltransferase
VGGKTTSRSAGAIRRDDLPLAVRVRRAVGRLVNRFGYSVYRTPKPYRSYGGVTPEANYCPWDDDQDFLAIYEAIRSFTLVDKYRCYELWTLVEQVAKLEGALLEVGVWKGGTGGLIAKRSRMCGIRDSVFLCDTFRGIVRTGDKDAGYRDGLHADTSETTVHGLLKDELQLDNYRLLKGIFPDETARSIPDTTFRFCHIDVDVYQSAKDVLAWVWPRMTLGGVVVYDDYGFCWCSGITRHVEEQRHLADGMLVYNLNGHALLIKIKAQ